MKKEKSLCSSCSNRIIIKYHGKKIESGTDKKHCFYDFKVSAKTTDHYGERYTITKHVSNVIVDQCSFYNKSMFRFKKEEKINKNISDAENDSPSKDNSNGVTFVNIPGALLP